MQLRTKEENDPATRKLESEGLVKFHSKKERNINKKKIREFSRITFDFWSGVKYIVVLSALLWWIPLFGPMLAGYVGGRRTGGPKKGLGASIVALFIIGISYYVLVHGFLSAYFINLYTYMNAQAATVSAHTLIDPYTEFLRYYWSEFFTRITTGIPFGPNNYVLTFIFSYIGGILSLEKRKEYTDGVRSLEGLKNDIWEHMKVPSREKKFLSDIPEISLKNLEAVKVNPSRKTKEGCKNQEGDRDDRRSEQKDEAMYTRDQNGLGFNPQVEHHSESSGDDWELL